MLAHGWWQGAQVPDAELFSPVPEPQQHRDRDAQRRARQQAGARLAHQAAADGAAQDGERQNGACADRFFSALGHSAVIATLGDAWPALYRLSSDKSRDG